MASALQVTPMMARLGEVTKKGHECDSLFTSRSSPAGRAFDASGDIHPIYRGSECDSQRSH
jgi:hypothetical protein